MNQILLPKLYHASSGLCENYSRALLEIFGGTFSGMQGIGHVCVVVLADFRICLKSVWLLISRSTVIATIIRRIIDNLRGNRQKCPLVFLDNLLRGRFRIFRAQHDVLEALVTQLET